MSHIVDYLRHTTSRGSGDSGLEELCNMLDPEHKDVSIDLDTYHAVMKEWIDDCRNNGYPRTDGCCRRMFGLRNEPKVFQRVFFCGWGKRESLCRES